MPTRQNKEGGNVQPRIWSQKSVKKRNNWTQKRLQDPRWGEGLEHKIIRG